MKGRQPADLRNLSNEELNRTLIDCEETSMNLRFQHALSELQNTAYLKTMHRDVARIKTILRERELSA